MKPVEETKADRFRRLAEARVNKIIKMIRLLGNCSGKGVYCETPFHFSGGSGKTLL